MITLALSKGRIFDETMPLLQAAGIEVLEDPEASRKLILPTNQPDVRVVLVRASDVPTYVLIPSFVTSELKTAFQIGAVLFLPFLVIDLVVASGCAALVYGIVMSVLGRRLPDTWIGEAILVFVIFYGIWIVLQWISDWGITGTYAVRGLVYLCATDAEDLIGLDASMRDEDFRKRIATDIGNLEPVVKKAGITLQD